LPALLIAQKATTNTLHNYASSSVLATGKFVKISVQSTGIYRLTYEDLNAMGIVPANVRIFGYGGELLEQDFKQPMLDDLPENAIYMNKGSDGIFNAGDYILFYAKGIHKWSFDKIRGMFTHKINSYATKGYYFVTSDAGIGKKIELKNIVIPAGATIMPVEDFTDYQVQEKELINIANSGKQFYGDYFVYDKNTTVYSFNFPNVLRTNTTKFRFDVAAATTGTSSTFSVDLDNFQIKTLSVSKRTDGDQYERAKAANATFNFTPTGDALNFKIVFNAGNNTAQGYLNFVEVNAQRALSMSGNAMQFQNVANLETSYYNQYKLSNANTIVQVWDITDAQNIAQMETQMVDGKLVFTASGTNISNYLAIDPTAGNSFPKPEIAQKIANQNLHQLLPAELLIITNPLFKEQAEALAEGHRTVDNLRVNVVTTEEVYNEFSSGTPDATAYRRLVKMFYDRAIQSGNASDKPKYLLLFGRGTFDNRKILSSSGDNLILTYQADNSLVETLSYVTDDYFGFLEDNEGTQLPSHSLEIGIGRFPVVTVEQAQQVVDKTINYIQNSNKGKWKNQLCFLADDGDNALHAKQADSIANILRRSYKDFQITKIYLDAYNQEISASGESYPVARKQLHDLISKGILYLNYTGHAAASGWTNELVMTTNDIENFSNRLLPLWFGATCDFLQFDMKTVSAGEKVLLNPNGGGIGVISAARPVYASQNFSVNKFFAENLLKKVDGKHYRIGDILRMAKNSVGSEINKLSYIFMGDPAVQLPYPTDCIVKTTTINERQTLGNDTLRAMSITTIAGNITDADGLIQDNFNGELSVDIFDKMQRITTQDNQKDGAMSYSDRPNVLFSGKAAVVNGAFSYNFMLPKDLRYNYGGGRINYYAYSNETGKEAQGNYENFIIGGTNPNAVYEKEGPEMSIHLNSPNFVNGDAVNESPLLMIELKDISGINKVGSGIGHDLVMMLDNDPSQQKVLNDYFETKPDLYSEGSIRYKLADLSDGKHVLTFKAWDLLNNSNTKSIEFEVKQGLQPVIFKVSNYPNPVQSQTTIVVEHDRPETILETTVEIFDLAGRKMWQFSQNNADNISWDLKGADGIKVKGGIYFYKVTINTQNSTVFSKTNKMLIVEK